MSDLYGLSRPLLFCLDAERAHQLTVAALRGAPRLSARILGTAARSPVEALGLRFSNPVGVAAGLDKHGDCYRALHAMGFGFVEIGTVTPRPQPGNPRPRIFRLPAHGAVINRLGFNSRGLDYLCRQVERRPPRGVLGINIGKNADTPNERALDDFRTGLERVYPLADYITVNISSPNTQGLRDLQAAEPLRALVSTLCERREALQGQHGTRRPLLVKLAPDLDEAQLDAVATALNGSGIDGVIATNTTISRPGLGGDPAAAESGGLSGRPLRELAQRTFSALRSRLDPEIAMVGVGGIDCAEAARERWQSGAALLQVYTGFIYRGPALLSELVREHQRLNRATDAQAS